MSALFAVCAVCDVAMVRVRRLNARAVQSSSGTQGETGELLDVNIHHLATRAVASQGGGCGLGRLTREGGNARRRFHRLERLCCARRLAGLRRSSAGRGPHWAGSAERLIGLYANIHGAEFRISRPLLQGARMPQKGRA